MRGSMPNPGHISELRLRRVICLSKSTASKTARALKLLQLSRAVEVPCEGPQQSHRAFDTVPWGALVVADAEQDDRIDAVARAMLHRR